MESTQEEQRERDQRIDEIFDSLPTMQLFADMSAAVGRQRVIELLGWAVLWNVSGHTDPRALREQLEAAGQSQAASYRALRDFRRIGTYLLEKHGWEMGATGSATLLRKIGVKMASA